MDSTWIRDILKPVLIPVHREGYLFIWIFAVATALFGFFWPWSLVVGGLLTVWCIFFFRNPDRVTPLGDGLVIAPADGVIQMIREVSPPVELALGKEPLTRISIFMNVFNVHVNRIPIDGVVINTRYHPGKFFNASLDKASLHNERMALTLETDAGARIGCVQIAGLVARRIVCDVSPGDAVRAGQRFGLIRFGSRVDIYLPRGTAALVCENQTAIGGETLLAILGSDAAPRQGESR